MHARDVMTTQVITVSPDTPVQAIAALLLKHRISAVPVADDAQTVIGLVSEGDLIRRVRDGDRSRRSWWLELVSDPAESRTTSRPRVATLAM